MLHSTLPRAFLPPGLSYLGGYYGEDAHAYAGAAGYVPCIEDPYVRIPDQRIHLGDWEPIARPTSPSPLDLSLKPPQVANPVEIVDIEAVELDDDDEDDRRYRGTVHRRPVPTQRSYSNCGDLGPTTEDHDARIRRSSSVHSYHSYDDVSSRNDVPDRRPSVHHSPLLKDEMIRSPPPIDRYRLYDDVPMKTESMRPTEDSPKPHPTHDASSPSCPTKPEIYHDMLVHKELLLTSPNHSRTHGYHQQLLLTPQHHLQTIHAPMTPPSTPSPPQCPRRRPREDPEVTPPHSSSTATTATPRHPGTVGPSEKPSPRPKKKHARRLKFDEDTSSPVSGTVILGPDEAVVTGDIDPAFNIVEVTEEARAELAKIENRLGPYQCKLCRQLHEDAFQLAQHRCSRIAHVEYRCPECDKRFSCPANLASHRRWHKPRITNGESSNGGTTAGGSNTSTGTATTATTGRDAEVACARCDAKFSRPAALRKHLASQHPETNNNATMANNNVNDYNSGFDDVNRSMTGKTVCVPGVALIGNASANSEIA